MRYWPMGWLLLGNRQVLILPVPYHSQLVGLILILQGAILMSPMVVRLLEDINFLMFRSIALLNFLFTHTIFFIAGFIFAMGWSFYFPERALVVQRGRVDVAYMLVHLAIDYFVIFLFFGFFYNRFSIVFTGVLGALIYHWLDICYFIKGLREGRIIPTQEVESRMLPELREAALSVESLGVKGDWRVEQYGERRLFTRQNPWYVPWLGFALLTGGVLFIIIPRFFGEHREHLELKILLAVNFFLSGFMIGIASRFYSKNLTLSVENARASYRTISVAVILSSMPFYLLLIGATYFDMGIVYIVIYSLNATVGSLFAQWYIVRSLFIIWKKEMVSPEEK